MSCSEWKKVKIGEICEVKGGKRLPKGKKLAGTKTNHPYVRIRDMYQHKYIEDDGTVEYIDDETYALISRYIVNRGDVIVAIVGNTIGLVSLIGNSLNNANLTENCVKLVNLNGISQEFIYYYLNSEIGQRNIKSRIVGTSQPKLPIYGVKNIEILVPPIQEQKAIANILSTLDEKIETNNQINKNLEEMAQAIFKHWFVDFEFPNKKGKPYKSSGGEMVESELGMIPKGWEVATLGEYIKFVKGKKPKIIEDYQFEDSEVYLTIDVLNRNSILYGSIEKVVFADKFDSLMVMDGASSGDVYFGQDGIVASTLAKVEIIEKRLSDSFIYSVLKFFENDIKVNLTGSAIPHIDKDYVYRIKIPLPKNNEVIEKFSNIGNKIGEKIINKQEESQNLFNLRDTLLPKLMSGEIRVSLKSEGLPAHKVKADDES